ncbi:hypothetical protein HYN76_23265 [Vibrio parahaemolyticus]|uniref:hypothetical protein n=1 Tax=Vibrio parahaemolyticus TaxID=670 RepID=UPI0015C50161|nr:hypothetical protein [Vibrio parahaemolyticus]MBM5091833.1 hypothetical protein [Vibrio parahaemolyticus]MBM5184741.1 hypothetical protein [Vibrio parahaemolyticus]
MKWGKRRVNLGTVIAGFSGPFVISTQSLIASTFLRVSIVIIFAFVLAISVSKQIEYIDETEL